MLLNIRLSSATGVLSNRRLDFGPKGTIDVY